MKKTIFLVLACMLVSCSGEQNVKLDNLSTSGSENKVQVEETIQHKTEEKRASDDILYKKELAPGITIIRKKEEVVVYFKDKKIASEEYRDISSSVLKETIHGFIEQKDYDLYDLTEDNKKEINDYFWNNYYYIKDSVKTPKDIYAISHLSYDGPGKIILIDTKTGESFQENSVDTLQVERGTDGLYILTSNDIRATDKNNSFFVIKNGEKKEILLEKTYNLEESCGNVYTSFELLGNKTAKVLYDNSSYDSMGCDLSGKKGSYIISL